MTVTGTMGVTSITVYLLKEPEALTKALVDDPASVIDVSGYEIIEVIFVTPHLTFSQHQK